MVETSKPVNLGSKRDPAVVTAALALVKYRLEEFVRGRNASRPQRVVLGLSGGADSLALTGILAQIKGQKSAQELGRKLQVKVRVIDHQLQDNSSRVAAEAAQQARGLGFPVQVIPVQVRNDGSGLEAAARTARLAALQADADAVLLAHTVDDQAETVLLGLMQGSGLRALAGMKPSTNWGSHAVLRPFLETDLAAASTAPEQMITRRSTEDICRHYGLEPWDDPHNSQRQFTRVRIRQMLTGQTALGEEDIRQLRRGLVRTAVLAGHDEQALQSVAQQRAAAILAQREGPRELADTGTTSGGAAAKNEVAKDVGSRETAGVINVMLLAAEMPAIRARILRDFVEANGAQIRQLTSRHVHALDQLLINWHGQGPVDLPGHRRGRRYRSDDGQSWLTVEPTPRNDM